MIVYSYIGFFAGLLHVLFGPDHMAAIAPIAAAERRRPWLSGLLWGAGHTSGVWLVGFLAIMFRGMLPIEAISSFSDRAIGVVLIIIGFWGFKKVFSNTIHSHEHSHDGQTHEHHHLHADPSTNAPLKNHSHLHTAFSVGTLHGFAGSSHFLGILPALALPSNMAAILYVVSFGVGTIVGMTAFAWAVGAFSKNFAHRKGNAMNWLLGGCSLSAILVGCIWLVI